MKDSFDEIFKSKDRVMVVMAHPDDMEITCGGIIARLSSQNKKVRLIVTTNGGKGMQEPGSNENKFADTRTQEQIEAGKILGIDESENFNLNIPDGELEASIENISKIALHIREFRPELIITHNPSMVLITTENNSGWVNHRDHRHTGLITIDAAYPYARDYGFFVDQLNDKVEPFSVREIMYSDSFNDPNTLKFAIDEFLDKKREALKKHIAPHIAENAEDYIDENKTDEGYFESLGYMKIY